VSYAYGHSRRYEQQMPNLQPIGKPADRCGRKLGQGGRGKRDTAKLNASDNIKDRAQKMFHRGTSTTPPRHDM